MALGFGADRPDKSSELARQSCHDFRTRLALVRQRPVAAVQPLLRSPRHRGDLGRECALQFLLPLADAWSMAIVPRRLDEDSSKVTIAGFGDGSALSFAATRVLRGHHAGVAHHLRGPLEATEAADL